jgi:hypothetical protein
MILGIGLLYGPTGGVGSYERGTPVSDRRARPPRVGNTFAGVQEFLDPHFGGGGVTKFAPHKALKLIGWRQVDF